MTTAKKNNRNNRIVRLALMTVLSAFIIITHAACGDESPVSKSDFCLDTVCEITIYDAMKEREAEAILDEAFTKIREYEDLFSRSIKGSDVDKVNNAGGKWTEVSDETIKIIDMADEISEASGGVFDITIGKVTKLWDFKAEEPQVPADEDVKASLSYVGFEVVDTEEGKVRLADPEAEIDLGGVAKGYIADLICDYLETEGVTKAIVNLGGNVVVIGEKAEDTPWTVGIERPFTDRKEVVGAVMVADKAVVTSGIYERNFEEDGVIYHHILNPATGYPAETDLEAVTIVADKGNSGFCDAVSTACLILGSKKASQFIEKLQNEYPDRGLEAAFIDNEGNIVQTDGMEIIPVE